MLKLDEWFVIVSPRSALTPNPSPSALGEGLSVA
jgi:hypothetical protein